MKQGNEPLGRLAKTLEIALGRFGGYQGSLASPRRRLRSVNGPLNSFLCVMSGAGGPGFERSGKWELTGHIAFGLRQ